MERNRCSLADGKVKPEPLQSLPLARIEEEEEDEEEENAFILVLICVKL